MSKLKCLKLLYCRKASARKDFRLLGRESEIPGKRKREREVVEIILKEKTHVRMSQKESRDGEREGETEREKDREIGREVVEIILGTG